MTETTLHDLAGLLERVTAASEMDWTLFIDVCNATLPPMKTNEDVAFKGRLVEFVGVQAWTEAALALVEWVLPGAHFVVATMPEGVGFYAAIGTGDRPAETGATPALALLAALLTTLLAANSHTGSEPSGAGEL